MLTLYIYWISTGLLSLLYLFSAFTYITKPGWVRGVLTDLGYPGYLLQFMIIVKVLGAVAILSRLNVALSDLAYAGIFYHLILSGMAHLGVNKPQGAVPAAAGLILLVASFATQNVAREDPSRHAYLASARPSTMIERL
ncbi:DoxX family protein [Rhizobium sp. 2YAF20]|uniref:DoxX family protein n=1 Tax=Rhizobium sp. 2YAF20 TaxID=3233027 RepID=UPI003F990D60